jgi:hypothetical protein
VRTTRTARKQAQRDLQAMGLNRFDARRVLYGRTLKQSTAPGMGVNRARPKQNAHVDAEGN